MLYDLFLNVLSPFGHSFRDIFRVQFDLYLCKDAYLVKYLSKKYIVKENRATITCIGKICSEC